MGMNALEVRRRVMLAQPHEAVASGAVASFVTDVLSPLPLEFDLNPVQDLHGYDNPWPGGGGKNKFDISSAVVAVGYNSQYFANGYLSVDITKTATGISSSTINQNCGRAVCLGVFPAGKYIVSFTNAGVQNTTFSINSTTTDVLSSTTGLSRTTIVSSQVSTSFTFTADGTSFYWLSAYKAGNDVTYSMQNIMVRLSSVSDATYAPYSNLCPITGHDGFTRVRTGINVWDEEWELGAILNGNPVSSTTSIRSTNFSACRPNTSYYVKSNIGLRLHWYDLTKAWIEMSASIGNGVITTPHNAYFFKIAFPTAYGTTYNNDISINYPSTDTAYHPYTGTSIETTFPTPPGTVYGGHVKDNGDGTGTLTVTHKKTTYTGADGENWSRSEGAGKTRVFIYISDAKKNSSSIWGNFIKSDPNAGGYPNEWKALFNTTPSLLIGVPSTITQASDWKTFLSSNNLDVVYELATPVSYTLPMTAIQSLIGQNHVWVDNADEVSVEYWGH